MTKVRSNYPEGVAWFPVPPLFTAHLVQDTQVLACTGLVAVSFNREGSTKERRGFSLFPLHCSLGFASRFLLPSGATRKRARRGRVWCRTLALAILWLRQEPISRRKQLPCTRVKAFSPTRLFLRAILARIWNILLVPQTSQQIPLT